uniref:Acylphosphatase n=1 Tax=Gasterosteus aculeatus aculeatus TaxID=481459 RepID=A0AAQ4PI60_GASAC
MDYRYHLHRASHVPLTNRKDCWCRVKGARQLQESPNPPPSLSLLLRRPLGMSEGESAGSKLLSVDFEIFGHVQGVCFRMYTEKKGLQLGLVGWVRNTCHGTVEGQVQGPAHRVDEMASRWRSAPSHQTRPPSAERFHFHGDPLGVFFLIHPQ